MIEKIEKYSKDLDIDIEMIKSELDTHTLNNFNGPKLNEYVQETIATMAVKMPDCSLLAGRLLMDELQESLPKTFSENAKRLYYHQHKVTQKHTPLISKIVFELSQKFRFTIDNAIDTKRDFKFDYMGASSLKKNYLIKYDDEARETPQFMYMRISLGIHEARLDPHHTDEIVIKNAILSYDLMSNFYFTHASPIMFHSGTPINKLASCYIAEIKGDSIEGIYDTLKDCALISKQSGGIAVSVHTIRGNKSYIAGSNGISPGLVPMLKLYNDTSVYVDQGFFY